MATAKKLNVVVGLQSRYEIGLNEMVTKIHDGEIGDIHSMDVYYNVGKATVYPRSRIRPNLSIKLVTGTISTGYGEVSSQDKQSIKLMLLIGLRKIIR